MIEFQHVFKSYEGDRYILANTNFQISAGEFVFISGASGAGKSTLIKLIAGLETATRGKIQVNGQRLEKMRRRARPYFRRAVGVILQDLHLLYDRSVFENIMLPLIVTGHDYKSSVTRVRAALEKVGLSGKEKDNPITLSGGEQQCLAIARAIVNRLAILIADEPTANLDHNSAVKIMNVFHDFNRVGVTVLIASHDRTLMEQYAQRTLSLESGQLKNQQELRL